MGRGEVAADLNRSTLLLRVSVRLSVKIGQIRQLVNAHMPSTSASTGGPSVSLGSVRASAALLDGGGDGTLNRWQSSGKLRKRAYRVAGENMFSVYGRMTAQPGRRDEVIALLHEGLRAGGEDSGLLFYSINTAFEDPDMVWLTQLWIDKEAHDRTTRSDPVAGVSRHLPSLLAGRPEGFYGESVHSSVQSVSS